MRILIVHTNLEIARFWSKYLLRQKAEVLLAGDSDTAIKSIRFGFVDAVILDMELPNGQSFEISDHACLFHPQIPIIAVTKPTFFSASDLFAMMPNARVLLNTPIQLADLKAVVDFYGEQLHHDVVELRAVS